MAMNNWHKDGSELHAIVNELSMDTTLAPLPQYCIAGLVGLDRTLADLFWGRLLAQGWAVHLMPPCCVMAPQA